MGISFSCPLAKYSDVENGLESIIVKSISFGDDEVKTPVRSVSFNSRDLESTIMMKSLGSGKMVIEASVSFKGRELENMDSIKAPSFEGEQEITIQSTGPKSNDLDNQSPRLDIQTDPNNPQHAAAVKLQKVYKSFRTRRKLADCAVLVEQSWWKVLDFAELKRSSISFFDIEKHETTISRWSRARTKAAKVGKGLSKNDKAQKLVLRHWLEAIDPRHRYGHNMQFYYVKWLHCQSKEPFFYWLDIGEGKEVNIEKCPRSKLQQQCIKYLGPLERQAYEVVLEDGKFFYKQSGELLDTSREGVDAKWIFVLSTSRILYVGKKKKGTFQHSSFLAGGATSAAGRLVVENGFLKAVWPHSGHYRPTEENFRDFISFLKENNVDVTDVKMSPVDEEDNVLNKQKSSLHFKSNSSEEDLIQKMNNGSEGEETFDEECTREKSDLLKLETSATAKPSKWKRVRSLSRKLKSIEMPKRVDDYETAEEAIAPNLDYLVQKQNLFDEEPEGDNDEVEIIPEESILKRINSHKEMKSYQLGKQLSCKWTTGAGPRIGCLRDYPSELQLLALEQVSLSPRSTARSRSYFSPRIGSGMSRKVFDRKMLGGFRAS